MKSQSVSNTSKSAEFRLSQIRFLGIVPRFAALLMLMGLVASSAYIGSSASSSDGLLTRKSVGSPVIGLSDSNSTVRPPRMPGYASLLAPLPPAPETIETFAGDCTTSKTVFNVGDTICVKVSGVPLSTFFPRRLILVNANFTIIDTADIASDPQTNTFVLDATSTIGGNTIDNRGTWQAIVVTPFFFFPEAGTTFSVTDPQNATADVGVSTTLTPGEVQAGTQAIFELQVKNYGPNDSANDQLTDAVPPGTTVLSF